MKDFFEELSGRKLPSKLILEIAQREKALRKSLGYSQEELAGKSGVSLGSLKRFERLGQISLESLLKLAFTLNALEPFDLLFPKDDRPASLDELFK